MRDGGGDDDGVLMGMVAVIFQLLTMVSHDSQKFTSKGLLHLTSTFIKL